jgi:hypothetical protein
MSRRRRTIAETIELYSIPNFNGCTEWAGAQSSFGYGIITYWEGARRTSSTAHKKVWEQTNGPVPAGHIVMHSCDNPACVKLDHLKLGTQTDNIRDMIAKGRDNFFGAGPIQVSGWTSPKS